MNFEEFKEEIIYNSIVRRNHRTKSGHKINRNILKNDDGKWILPNIGDWYDPPIRYGTNPPTDYKVNCETKEEMVDEILDSEVNQKVFTD